jgi:16S rRNA (adenine(1408)-N(1))-methyltransferase
VLVLRGRESVTIEAEDFAQRCADATRVVIDIGTGDARWAYRQARAEPSWLVIGLDPARDRMQEVATRLARKPARGGLDNLLLVPRAVERPDPELVGSADAVHVLLPWGTLLRAVVLGEPAGLRAIRALARDGAAIEVVVGTDVWDDPVPLDARDLPTVDVAFVHDTLADRYGTAGLPIDEARMLDVDEWHAIESSWARRLADGRRQPKFIRIRATAA